MTHLSNSSRVLEIFSNGSIFILGVPLDNTMMDILIMIMVEVLSVLALAAYGTH